MRIHSAMFKRTGRNFQWRVVESGLEWLSESLVSRWKGTKDASHERLIVRVDFARLVLPRSGVARQELLLCLG